MIIIDPEFQALIPPLTADERRQLEENIARDGCLDPLKVWRQEAADILIDGHNRYEICNRLGITFETATIDGIESRDDATVWIVDNQVGRRNIPDYARVKLGLAKSDVFTRRAKENQGTRTDLVKANTDLNGGDSILGNILENSPKCLEKINTRVEIAKSAGVSDNTVGRVKVIEAKAAPEVIAKLMSNEMSINEAYKQVKQAEKEEKREDRRAAAAELESAPSGEPAHCVEVGQWWRLGGHLLYCGDTSQPEFYGAIDGAAFAFADPPYNAGVADWDTAFEWNHDWLIERAPVVAVTPGIASAFTFARKTAMPYRWTAACWISNGMTRGELGFGNWIPTFLFSEKSLHRTAQDFLKVTINISETDATGHKGRKPSELLLWLIETFTAQGEMVIDPFLGSGTTLFAAEKSGRACIGGELNPGYCCEIIARWEAMTGQTATRRKDENSI